MALLSLAEKQGTYNQLWIVSFLQGHSSMATRFPSSLSVVPVPQRLAHVRQVMKTHRVQAAIILTADPHKTEYLPAFWNAREYLSGFTGSSGSLVITSTKSGLWTDFRYYIQAAQELKGSTITLFKSGEISTPSIIQWLCQTLKSGDAIGYDPMMVSIKELRGWKHDCDEAGIILQPIAQFIDHLWPNRPTAPCRPVVDYPVSFAGVSRTEKIKQVRARVAAKRCNVHLITSLYDVAWLLNLRGDDTPCTPVFMSFVVVTYTKVILFVDPAQVAQDVQTLLKRDGIKLLPYTDIIPFLKSLPKKSRVLLNPDLTPIALRHAFPTQVEVVEESPLPSATLKAVKNDTEIKGIRRALVHDAVALTRFFMWVEQRLNEKKIPQLSEYECCEKMLELRAQMPNNRGASFPSIVGHNANGAIVHYFPSPTQSSVIKPKGIILVDSGGQYLDGTTDTTRTVAVGPTSSLLKKDFSLVLKGHVALARMIFPATVRGYQLDMITRRAMWEQGIEFDHGTGHGVGSYLNVHEGPHGISNSVSPSMARLVPGMLVTNEPGIYREGQHGIRTENMLLVAEHQRTSFGQFLCFETLTRFPYDARLMDRSLLDDVEIGWINAFHKTCYRDVSPLLNATEKAWFKKATEPL